MKPLILVALFFFISPVLSAQVKSSKRGVSYGYHSAADMNVVSQGISWWYNWSTQPDVQIRNIYSGYNVEFVPMAWNASGISGLEAWISQDHGIKNILGFNEPNFIDQANMTPSQAAAAWPQLQALADKYGLKLVSPAVNYCGNCVTENGTTYTNPFKWLDDFFKACAGCRVDYIALHWYGGGNSIVSYINDARKYKKPIWVTEFAGWDQGMTASDQKNFLAGATNFLERDPDVFRYSWFTGRGNGPSVFPYIDLFGTSGTLTTLGQLYMNIPVYDSTRVFQIPGVIQAEEYYLQNGTFSELTRDADGLLNVGYIDAGDWLEYKISVSESGEYSLKTRYAGTSPGQFDVYIDNQKRGTVNTTSTGDWQYWNSVVNTIHLDAGMHIMKLLAVSKGFNLNWLDFSGITTGTEDIINDFSGIKVFPNPVTGDAFKISYGNIADQDEISFQITDVNGTVIYSGKSDKNWTVETEINLNLAGIKSKGIYLIRFKNSRGYTNRKLVVL